MSRFATIAAALALVSCGPKDQTSFVKELDRYFNKLNSEGMARREMVMQQAETYSKNPAALPPTGMQYNTYHFSEKGYIATNVTCRKPECRQTYVVVDYYGNERLCSRCGAVLIKARPKEEKQNMADWLRNEVKAEVKPMFEVTSKGEPMKAKVRYIRRNWSFDPSGKSDIDVAKMGDSKWKAEIKTDYLPGAAGGKVGAGFHRPDATYVAEQEFEFDGVLKALGPAREEPVAPWNEIWNPRASQEISR